MCGVECGFWVIWLLGDVRGVDSEGRGGFCVFKWRFCGEWVMIVVRCVEEWVFCWWKCCKDCVFWNWGV